MCSRHSYALKAEDETVCKEWQDSIERAVKSRKDQIAKLMKPSLSEKARILSGKIYRAPLFQAFVGAVILASFGLNIYAAQVLPGNTV